jgi:parvulin-like peptidyl-prolyl isomerase
MVARAQVIGFEAERLWRDRLAAFDDAVLEHLMTKEAEKQGISVSERQVCQRASGIAKQELDQLKLRLNGEALEQALAEIASRADGRARQSMSEQEFLPWFTDLLADTQSDDLRAALVSEALVERVTSSITATEKELLAFYDEVRLREILVAIHPSGGPERSDEEARRRAQEVLERAKRGADFDELVHIESDDEDVRYTRGLQEPISVLYMSPAYQEAVGSLSTGELLPEPIRTDQGYVIVKIEKREQRLPEGYQENTQQYLSDLVQRRRHTAWQEYIKQLRKEATVEVLDPEILAYQEIAEGNLQEALPLLRQAAPIADRVGGFAAASVYYKLGTVASAQSKWQEAADAYAVANDLLAGQAGAGALAGVCAQPLMGLGFCYENLGDEEEAIKWYQAASEATSVPSRHEHLMLTYRRMGYEDLAKREQEWIDEYRRQEADREKTLRERRYIEEGT